jgi:hypothetical protein
LMWREALAEVVVVRLSGRGGLDLADLEGKFPLPSSEAGSSSGRSRPGRTSPASRRPSMTSLESAIGTTSGCSSILPPWLPMPRST